MAAFLTVDTLLDIWLVSYASSEVIMLIGIFFRWHFIYFIASRNYLADKA